MHRMCWLVGLAAGLGIIQLASQVQGADERQEIQEMEQKWAEAVQRNKPDEIGAFLHGDFTFINPRGQLLHRAEHLDDFRRNRTVFTKVELSEVEIRVYGDAAIVTSQPTITGFAVTAAGKTTFDAQPARFTDTLIRRDGKWQSVARHMSLVSG
jgi:ketosteroid isomerase-like protein